MTDARTFHETASAKLREPQHVAEENSLEGPVYELIAENERLKAQLREAWTRERDEHLKNSWIGLAHVRAARSHRIAELNEMIEGVQS